MGMTWNKEEMKRAGVRGLGDGTEGKLVRCTLGRGRSE